MSVIRSYRVCAARYTQGFSKTFEQSRYADDAICWVLRTPFTRGQSLWVRVSLSYDWMDLPGSHAYRPSS